MSKRHELTPAERQKGHEARTRGDRKRAGLKGWITRRANGGFGLTDEERARGTRAAAEIAKGKGHRYFVGLGRASGKARRAKLTPAERRELEQSYRKPREANPVVSCACGCGQTFEKYGARGKLRRFVKGHHGRQRRARG